MTSKDELYDPAVNYDSAESDTELNNSRAKFLPSPSPPSSPLREFIHNDLGRKGGPLSGNDPAQASGGEIKRCSNCNLKTDDYYEASRFQCHRKYAEYSDMIAKHNTLCKECATDWDKCDTCPIHGDPYEAFSMNINPRKVK